MTIDNDLSASGYMTSQYEGINHEFTELQELPSRGYCGLMKAKRYGRWFLLKYLKPEYRTQAVYQQMLRKEFEILMTLVHPSVMQVIGMEDVQMLGQGKVTCLITEWIDGVTLKEFLATNPNKQERVKVATEIAEALSYIHSQQIAHRDLKPSNIMVTHNGHNAKIIDFGLADTDAHAILKQPAGTVRYMAPEQMTSSVSDCRNDIYSFGLILEELHLGRIYQGVVRKCLLPVERRYQNMDLVVADIKRRQKNWWGAIALIVGILLATVFLWTQLKDTQKDTERLNRNAHALNQEIKELKGEQIKFEDPQVKQKCIDNWDTDGDGELSYAEAAAVKTLGNVFTNDILINYFDELEYFTGLNEIARDAFNGCANLRSVKLPNTILSIRQNAFRGTGLYSIVIPQRAITFGDHVLEDCQNLETVIDLAFNPQSTNDGSHLFQNCPNLTTIFVPKLRVEWYQTLSDYNWDEWKDIIRDVIPFQDPQVKKVCVINWDHDKDGELSVDEAMAVEELGKVFTGNAHIRSFNELKYFTGLKTIGMYAFMGCTNLESIRLPQSIRVIDQYAFANCRTLKKVDFPDQMESVNHMAFLGCHQLDSLFIPASVNSWSYDAIYDCLSLKTLKVSPGNPYYDSREDCNALIRTRDNQLISAASDCKVPDGVESTSPMAFTGTHFKMLAFPASVKLLGSWGLNAVPITYGVMMESPIPPRYNYQGGWFAIFRLDEQMPTIYVPYGSIDAYRKAYGWSLYAKNMVEYPARPTFHSTYGHLLTPATTLIDSIPKFDMGKYAVDPNKVKSEFNVE